MFAENNKISNLKELIQSLKDESGLDSYAEVLKNIRFSFSEIEHLCFWDPDFYSKITIEKNGKFELALICWEKGQQSAIHNHSNEEAWTYVVKGELKEEMFNDDELAATKVLKKRKVSSLLQNDHKKHRLSNNYDGRSVSLHLYKH